MVTCQQVQRWSSGTSAMTASAWSPHPAQVVLPHREHRTATHIERLFPPLVTTRYVVVEVPAQ